MKDKLLIGITDCPKFSQYKDWIESEEGFSVLKLTPEAANSADAGRCNGIILSGGEDVHPRRYGKDDYLRYCHDIDERRDDFEWDVLAIAERQRLPLLGICRGLQVANVYYGGTLIPDIPSFGRFNHAKFPDRDRRHTVIVDPDSELASIAGTESGMINSSHHQGADLVGKGLIANALSPDGVIEGIERQNKEGEPFFMLVQWHPERMEDRQSPFSLNLKRKFLEAVRAGAR